MSGLRDLSLSSSFVCVCVQVVKSQIVRVVHQTM